MREKYGVELKGISGTETIWCDTRADANRVRRVYRQWVKQDGWTGWGTLKELAETARDNQGKSVDEIIGIFNRNRKELM